MHAYPSGAPRIGRAVALVGSIAILSVVIFAVADPAVSANNPGGVAARSQEGPPPTPEEASAAFRWEANNISNWALSGYMNVEGSDDADRYDLFAGLFTTLLRGIDEDAAVPERRGSAPTVAEAATDLQAAAEEAFDSAVESYTNSPNWDEYSRLLRAFARAAEDAKNSLANNPDDVWMVAVGSCLGEPYVPYDPRSTSEFHSLVLNQRITVNGISSGQCPSGPLVLSAGFLGAGLAGIGAAPQGDDVQCPRGWCPHRGGCIPCGG